jgi:aspartate/methionine/tyrosine aminotransferase
VEWHDAVNKIYTARREKIFELLELLKCSYSKEQAGLFVWATIPAGFEDGYSLSDDILYNANVFLTPGGIFGDAGDKYIRVSLCCKEENITEAIKRISNK